MSKYPNSGTLNKNERKENDRHPDYKGQGTVAGVDYWLDAWIKPGRDGSKFLSISFKPKEERPPAGNSVEDRVRAGVKEHFPVDDEIPF